MKSYWSRVGASLIGLVSLLEEEKTDTQEEGDVMTEADVGVRWLQATEGTLPDTTRS